VHEARGDRFTSERLLEQVYAMEGPRMRVSQQLSPLIVQTLVLRGELESARTRMDLVLRPGEAPENLPLLLTADAHLRIQEERWSELPALAARLREVAALTGAKYLAPYADRIDGHAASAARKLDDALRSFQGAASKFDATDMAVDAAIARLDTAETLTSLGHFDDASRTLADALPALQRAGFKQALTRAAVLLERAAR
jgi:hypothetical protein